MRLIITSLVGLLWQTQVLAAEASQVSPTGSILKMVLGLGAVLAVMALLSWVVKRLLPNGAASNSAIKVVGGVNVGSREKVVVLEVADRWLVVGVAQGQVSSIANLDAGSDQLQKTLQDDQEKTDQEKTDQQQQAALDAAHINPLIKPMVKPFSSWLKKSVSNIQTKQS